MKVLVTGSRGQLGQAVCAELIRRGIPCVPTTRADFDLTDREAVRAFVADAAPDAIVHCAAYTDVERAENEPERCMAVNATGSAILAQAAAENGAKLLLVSTDYVFSGEKDAPYLPDDVRAPLNVYGLSKLQAEEAVRSLCKRSFIVRSSWLFSALGETFVQKIIRAGRESRNVRVVCDQIGAPTYAPDLAAHLCHLIGTERFGISHAVNDGFCSRSDFAAEILRITRIPSQVTPIPTSALPAAVRRPLNSCLSCEGSDGLLPPWQSGLGRCVVELQRRGEL